MSTAMNTTDPHHQASTFGFLLIIADLVNNDQRDEILQFLRNALKTIDANNPLLDVNERFNDLINEKEFQVGEFSPRLKFKKTEAWQCHSLDSQYRQIENSEEGSLVGFLYMPNFHTVTNVLHDYINHCSRICLIFCGQFRCWSLLLVHQFTLSISGQQIDSDGALVLADSLFTTTHFSRLFPSDGSTRVEGLQLILPFASSAWKKLIQDQLPKSVRYAQITDASGEIDEENRFGEIFYQKLCSILHDDTVNFDIHTKLIPRDSSGTSEKTRMRAKVMTFLTPF